MECIDKQSDGDDDDEVGGEGGVRGIGEGAG